MFVSIYIYFFTDKNLISNFCLNGSKNVLFFSSVDMYSTFVMVSSSKACTLCQMSSADSLVNAKEARKRVYCDGSNY